MAEPWSNTEVELIIADYFSMLTKELTGNPINKTSHRIALKELLNSRSEGSIEFKHQNITAVLMKLGLPFIKGYKARWNYQQILEEKILAYLENHKSFLESKFIHFTDSFNIQSHNLNFNRILDTPPIRQNVISEPKAEYLKSPIKINYLEREQTNSTLGVKGEKLILEYEKWRLTHLGRASLADKIEWVAEYDDTAGFDILSKNENGTDRFIEVKTTRLSKETPIFFSKNEYNFSLKNQNNFHLYRLFNFNDTPKLFSLKGSFDDFCNKEPVQYKGIF